jgi:carbon storage regulator
VLVLTRKVGEAIVIGDDVTVTVLEVRGDVVRLGIDAPRSIRVHRHEVLAQISEQNLAAAAVDPAAAARVLGASAAENDRERP